MSNLKLAHSAEKTPPPPKHPFAVISGKGRGSKYIVRTNTRAVPFDNLKKAEHFRDMLGEAWELGRRTVLPEIANAVQIGQDELDKVTKERDELMERMVSMELLDPVEDKVLGGLKTRLQGKLIPLFAASFADLFIENNGVHFVTFEMEDTRLGVYELTISRILGKSPAQQLADADRLFDRVKTVIGNICPDHELSEDRIQTVNPCNAPNDTEGRALYYVLRDVIRYRTHDGETPITPAKPSAGRPETMPVDFPGSNAVLAKDQPEYRPLPCHIDESPEGYVTSCWELSDSDLSAVIRSRRVFVRMMAFGRPPMPLLVMGTFQTEFHGEAPPTA